MLSSIFLQILIQMLAHGSKVKKENLQWELSSCMKFGGMVSGIGIQSIYFIDQKVYLKYLIHVLLTYNIQK